MKTAHKRRTIVRLKNRSRASAYMAAMASLTVLAGLTVSFVTLIASQSASALTKRQSARAYYIAEAGINAALAELNANRDYAGDGPGNTTGNVAGGSYVVTAVENAPDDYTLTSVGTYNGQQRAIQVVAQRPSGNIRFNALAAITSNNPVWTTGSITIDGRDHSINGVLSGPGVWGIVGSSTVTRAGNSAIGGLGIPPTRNSDVFLQFYNWGDDGYPNGPDAALGLPDGTLKQIAEASGTYFDSQSALNEYITANGGNVPGGKIIYAEIDAWLPSKLGTSMNEEPSILIVHNSSNNAMMQNLHGQFKGLIFADWIVHINSNSVILGAIMSFSAQYYGTIYGNGNADVLYSSEVLANLPSNPFSERFLVRSWREVPVE